MRAASQVGRALLTLLVVPLLATCGPVRDMCVPQRASYGFFSRGDCIATRASFFQGHEWLTVLANDDLPVARRFDERSIQRIAEGNRRVDWPKELLVHMNTSVLSYVGALLDYTEVPSRQADHFLLSDRNTTEEAVFDAREVVRAATAEAVRFVADDAERSLAAIGRANHVIQDSFSEAHARRDVTNVAHPACVVKVKSFIARAPGFDTPDIEYHGDITALELEADDEDEDDGRDSLLVEGIGHTTTQDSIYRPGRECHRPATRETVSGCLSDAAKRARRATRDYLELVSELTATRGGTADVTEEAEARALLEAFFATHMQVCP